MQTKRMITGRTLLGTATAIAALALAMPASAQDEALPELPRLPAVGMQPMSQAEVNALPAEYRRLPVTEETSTTMVDENGVETITRTRRITTTAPVAGGYETAYEPAYTQAPQPVRYVPPGYHQATYAPAYAPMILDREQWLEECERRTRGRDRDERGGIIGGLLGAIGGGIAGNRIAGAGERLGGTLIGAGVGGLTGILLGNLFDGDDDEDRYDCEGAIDAYLEQYSTHGGRFASRTIAAPAQVAYPGYGYGYSYAQPSAYYYQPQPTMVMVPVTTYQQQRVVVRETVREEMVPGNSRSIPRPVPQPLPSPKMIKQAPAPVYAPAPSPKLIKQ
jgi:hypothetical protein